MAPELERASQDLDPKDMKPAVDPSGWRPADLGVMVVTPPPADTVYRVPIDNGGGRDTVSPDEVRESGALTLQEILRRTPSVYSFEETGTDGKPNIALRGVTSSSEGAGRTANLTLLADGIPLAPAPYGHGGQSLFPFTRERVHAVDILRGGYTTRYGPQNVAGVINFITKPIPDRTELEQRFWADSYGDGSTYTSFGGTWGRLGALAEAVYKGGPTYRDHGDFTIQNYALKTSYAFSDTFRGLFQFEYYDEDSDLADGLPPSALAQDPSQSLSLQNRFTGQQTRGNFRLEWDVGERSRFDLIGYAWTLRRTFELGSPPFYGDDPDRIDATPRPMGVWALQPQYSSTYDTWGGTGDLLVGLRYQAEDITRRSIRTLSDGTVTVRSDNNYDYGALSAFVENTFTFERWTVTPGLRLESVEMEGHSRLNGASAERDFDEVLPALSASYLMTDTWSVYANVQNSFAPPQANQIELSGDPQQLDAQTAWTYELGTRGDWAGGLIRPDLTFYWIDYEGRIERDPDFNDVFLNRSNTVHRGVELALGGEFAEAVPELAGLEWYGALSYNDSEFTNGDFDGNEVPHAPHWIAQVDLVYRHADTGLWAGFGGYHVGEAYSDSENTVPINAAGTRGVRPSYTVWNARGGWDHELTEDVRLELQLGSINLFDEDYFEIRAGRGLFPGPPLGAYTTIGIKTAF